MTRITLEETNDFATALRARRLAIGMDLATLRGFLDRAYTAAQIDRWEAGTSSRALKKKAAILASLACVQSEILAAYESYIHDIAAHRFPVPSALLCPTTQEDYEAVYGDMAEKLPLVAYRRLLEMLHVRLGLPVVAMNVATEREEIFS